MKQSAKTLLKTARGEIIEYTVQAENGFTVSFLNLGGTLTRIVVPRINGDMVDVISGYADPAKYLTNNPFFGAIVGRVANRIRNATFSVGTHEYRTSVNFADKHTLHGGHNNLSNYLWQVSEIPFGYKLSAAIEPSYDGFPGTLTGNVYYTLQTPGILDIRYDFTTDADTIVNLTSHAYFNLNGAGAGNILKHSLSINANFYLAADSDLINSGAILPVTGSPFDFTASKTIGRDIDHPALTYAGQGYDVCYAIDDRTVRSGEKPAAEAVGDLTGIRLAVYTDQPGMQFYSANSLQDEPSKKNGSTYGKYDFFCLETQHFPGAERFAHFPSIERKAGETYRHFCRYSFGE